MKNREFNGNEKIDKEGIQGPKEEIMAKQVVKCPGPGCPSKKN